MQPVLTLTHSVPLCQPPASVHQGDLQTTPKLPKRERLASFSRLVGSDNVLELVLDKTKFEGRRFRKLMERNFDLEPPPDIRILPPSPQCRDLLREKDDCSAPCTKECFDSSLLPFSPSFLNFKSPNYLSPSYKQPTPTKSPLYSTAERRTSFLGRGSFGNVTLCTYKGTQFALKVTNRNGAAVGEENFLGIRHPHLVTILHITQVHDQVFICMNFAGRCNLQQVLDTKSELDFPRRLSFCIQIVSGLGHCHRHRIIHGDVKPANVIVSPYGICKLGDFGHSIGLDRVLPSEKLPQLPEEIIGTAPYAAPEVLRGARPSFASDMYSFGILLWQVQTREFPFAGEHPHVIIYKVAHYGCRPTFLSGDEVSGSFSETAELCWKEDPDTRLTAFDTQKVLKKIMHDIKLSNENLSKPCT